MLNYSPLQLQREPQEEKYVSGDDNDYILPENEYIGLSQETRSDSDSSSRSSTEILYTLMHGIHRYISSCFYMCFLYCRLFTRGQGYYLHIDNILYQKNQ